MNVNLLNSFDDATGGRAALEEGRGRGEGGVKKGRRRGEGGEREGTQAVMKAITNDPIK